MVFICRMAKTLIFGYSVTADKSGFAFQLAAESTEFEVCGIGGLHPFNSAYLIPQILDQKRPDVLILEVATGASRGRPKWEYFWSLCFMVEAALRRNIVVGFAHMYRADVNYDDDSDVVLMAAKGVADLHGVPVLNLGLEVQRQGLGGMVLRDVVHTTPDGGKWYADRVKLFAEEIGNNGIGDNFEPIFPGELAYTLSLAGDGPNFERTGYNHPFTEFTGTFSHEFGREENVNGLLFVMGPDTGIVGVETGLAPVTLTCFDQHCYYVRFNAQAFPTITTRQITATMKGRPDVRLIKGEAGSGRPVGKLCAALCTSIPLKEIERAVSGYIS